MVIQNLGWPIHFIDFKTKKYVLTALAVRGQDARATGRENDLRAMYCSLFWDRAFLKSIDCG